MPKPSIRILVAIAATLALAGCAQAEVVGTSGAGSGSEQPGAGTPDPSTELGALPTPIPAGEVLGQGTVLDDGDGAELCLGPIAESYPPQCTGLAVDGWDWGALDGWEEASGVRWGAFVVQGAFDGERFAVVGEPLTLALYDPAPIDEEPLEPGTTSDDELARIQDVVADALGDRLLTASIADGRLEVAVVYDDGTLQQHLDDAYGTDVVRVTSALRDLAS